MTPTTRHGDPISTDLSPSARHRKAEILADLRSELRVTRTRHTLIRGGSVAALLLVITTLVWIAKHPLPGGGGGGEGSALKPLPEGGVGVGSIASTSTRNGGPHADALARAAAPKITIALIRTDPTTLDRLAIQPTTSRIETITDDQLLQAMQEAGKPAGLIRAKGQLTVVELVAPATVGG